MDMKFNAIFFFFAINMTHYLDISVSDHLICNYPPAIFGGDKGSNFFPVEIIYKQQDGSEFSMCLSSNSVVFVKNTTQKRGLRWIISSVDRE
jgi:hypothetical protein